MKKKKLIIISIISILIVIFLIGLLFLSNKDRIVLKQDTFIFELGEEVPFGAAYYLNDDSIKDINKINLELENRESIIIQENKLLSDTKDYLNVGKYPAIVSYKKETKKFMIEVKDTTKPEFKEFNDKIVIEQNAKDVDLTKFFKAEDLTHVELSIEGEYDLSKIGDFEITIVATDESKNQSKKQFTLTVISLDEAKKDNSTSKTIDGTIYKSEAMVEYENNKNKPVEQPKQPTQKPSNNTNNKPASNNLSTNKPVQSFEGYNRDAANAIFQKINDYRVSQGRDALPFTDQAQAEADMRAKQIITNFSHNSSYGFGENIGNNVVGYDFFTAWKNSWSHNNAMLREQCTAMAVSVYEKDGMWYAVVSFKMNY